MRAPGGQILTFTKGREMQRTMITLLALGGLSLLSASPTKSQSITAGNVAFLPITGKQLLDNCEQGFGESSSSPSKDVQRAFCLTYIWAALDARHSGFPPEPLTWKFDAIPPVQACPPRDVKREEIAPIVLSTMKRFPSVSHGSPAASFVALAMSVAWPC
jgi:hypothetical protein